MTYCYSTHSHVCHDVSMLSRGRDVLPSAAAHCNAAAIQLQHCNTAATQLQHCTTRKVELFCCARYDWLEHTTTHCNTLQHATTQPQHSCNTAATQLQHSCTVQHTQTCQVTSRDVSPLRRARYDWLIFAVSASSWTVCRNIFWVCKSPV